MNQDVKTHYITMKLLNRLERGEFTPQHMSKKCEDLLIAECEATALTASMREWMAVKMIPMPHLLVKLGPMSESLED